MQKALTGPDLADIIYVKDKEIYAILEGQKMVIDRENYMDGQEEKLLRTVTEGQAIKDLRAGRVGGVRRWMLVDLALQTGLRVAEMAALEIQDVDLKRGSLSVVRLKRKRKKREPAEKYNQRNRETLAISKSLTQHLKEYVTWTGRRKGRLFVGSRGNLTSQGLQLIWKRAIKEACLPKRLSIHSARHTCATRIYRETGNVKATQRQLGHSTSATTLDMYTGVSFEDMKEIQDKASVPK